MNGRGQEWLDWRAELWREIMEEQDVPPECESEPTVKDLAVIRDLDQRLEIPF